MSRRGLLVALLCGVLGLGVGAVVAYAAQPGTTYVDQATPLPAVSPSVPIDEPSRPQPYRRDIDYPRLEPGLALPIVHTIGNDLAQWTYHVPLGWHPYWVCSTSCPPGVFQDKPMPDNRVNTVDEVRFRPPDEPSVGGYSLRVRILDNTLNDVHQTVATKVVGFRDSPAIAEFNITERTPSSVYFDYRDADTNLHRFNYFQWFAVPGQTNATLEMSVSGRQRDVPGLKALFDRFADNVTGSMPPSGQGGPGSPGTTSPSP
jgi:hypothetical protein